MTIYRVVETWTVYNAWYVEAETETEAVELLSAARDAEEDDVIADKAIYDEGSDSDWTAYEIAESGDSMFTADQLRAMIPEDEG
jgi:hypothetical protein